MWDALMSLAAPKVSKPRVTLEWIYRRSENFSDYINREHARTHTHTYVLQTAILQADCCTYDVSQPRLYIFRHVICRTSRPVGLCDPNGGTRSREMDMLRYIHAFRRDAKMSSLSLKSTKLASKSGVKARLILFPRKRNAPIILSSAILKMSFRIRRTYTKLRYTKSLSLLDETCRAILCRRDSVPRTRDERDGSGPLKTRLYYRYNARWASVAERFRSPSKRRRL